MKYRVEVPEVWLQVYEVEADSEEQAIRVARDGNGIDVEGASAFYELGRAHYEELYSVVEMEGDEA